MLVILGKTSSGKDVTLNNLITEHGYKKIITYTTRPMRHNEQQDVTYHFIPEDDFIQRINDGFFAEWKTYNTEFGLWYYGTSLEDLENADDNSAIILTPDGYRDIINKLSKKPISIYLYADDYTIKNRLIKRGDNPKEAERRLLHDNEDFLGIENEVDKVIFNNFDTDISNVIYEILYFIERKGDV